MILTRHQSHAIGLRLRKVIEAFLPPDHDCPYPLVGGINVPLPFEEAHMVEKKKPVRNDTKDAAVDETVDESYGPTEVDAQDAADNDPQQALNAELTRNAIDDRKRAENR